MLCSIGLLINMSDPLHGNSTSASTAQQKMIYYTFELLVMIIRRFAFIITKKQNPVGSPQKSSFPLWSNSINNEFYAFIQKDLARVIFLEKLVTISPYSSNLSVRTNCIFVPRLFCLITFRGSLYALFKAHLIELDHPSIVRTRTLQLH